MYKMKIKFGTAKNAALFINDCQKYDCDIDLKCGRYIVDGKSLLGVMSICPDEVCTAILHSADENVLHMFKEDMRLWSVED